jgi:hypothetical protein
MTIAELIAAARATEVDDAKLDAMEQRMSDAEKYNEVRASSQSVNSEFLARTYSL